MFRTTECLLPFPVLPTVLMTFTALHPSSVMKAFSAPYWLNSPNPQTQWGYNMQNNVLKNIKYGCNM